MVPSTPPMPPAVVSPSASPAPPSMPQAVTAPQAHAVHKVAVQSPGQPSAPGRSGMVWLGVILILLGIAFLVSRVTDIGVVFWPVAFVGLILVALGIRTILTRGDDW